MTRIRLIGLATILTGFLLFAISAWICVSTHTWTLVAGLLVMALGIEVLFTQLEDD